jgi:desulfoferrodoxin (superoxide reductase-like protein)
VEGFPTLLFGDTAKGLKSYEGDRSLAALTRHALRLQPPCDLAKLDACVPRDRALAEQFMALPAASLQRLVAAKEGEAAEAEAAFRQGVDALKALKAAMGDELEAVRRATVASGLGLMRAVRAERKVNHAAAMARAAELMAAAGPPRTAAQPGEWAGKEAKHVPTVTVHGGKVTVTVPHAMAGDHWVEYLWLRDNRKVVIGAVKLGPTDQPELVVSIPKGTIEVTAYEYCNL